MKMDLIQPFINAADAVLSQGLSGTTKVGHLSMEEDGYRRKGVAGMVALSGDIEGRIILDLEPQTAVRVASHYAGAELPESDGLIKETIFELANQVVGNAVCALNDQGFHFRVHPPLLLTSEEGDKTSEDVEALMICFETSLGNVFMNVALRHNKQRMSDHATGGRITLIADALSSARSDIASASRHESSPESSAASAIFLNSGYFWISVGGASTRLPADHGL